MEDPTITHRSSLQTPEIATDTQRFDPCICGVDVIAGSKAMKQKKSSRQLAG